MKVQKMMLGMATLALAFAGTAAGGASGDSPNGETSNLSPSFGKRLELSSEAGGYDLDVEIAWGYLEGGGTESVELSDDIKPASIQISDCKTTCVSECPSGCPSQCKTTCVSDCATGCQSECETSCISECKTLCVTKCPDQGCDVQVEK